MLFNLTQQLASTFFDSLREGYLAGHRWFVWNAGDFVTEYKNSVID